MKPGLRLQLLLLLGGLVLLGFVPLFHAVATYTSYTLRQSREQSTLQLGRTLAGHLAQSRASDVEAAVAHVASIEGAAAAGVYDRSGRALAESGEPAIRLALAEAVRARRREAFEVPTAAGPAVAVLVERGEHTAGAAVRARGRDTTGPLLRLLGLYMAVVALALLVLSYFALTHWIVRPLGELSAAAERVARGARRLEVPRGGARELLVLGTSLKTMTERLIGEEEALRRKVEEVERAKQHLAEAQARLVRSERLASVGRLAAGLAHEIGNPISALIGLEDLLLDGGLEPAEQRDFLQRMRKETERINKILRDLLQFARPASHSADEPVEPGDVEAAIYDTAALVAPQKAMHDVELELDVHPGLPRVSLSREHLMQVLLNLVMNAADASGPGGVVRIRAQKAGEQVQLVVEDTGPGVAPEVVARLFEPFVTTKEVGKGTGLGLAVCRGLVEAAFGSIQLDAAYTSGARFVIELPAAA